MHQYEHKARIDVPPHVFAIAECAYRTMVSEEDNQCVIISGESGAGKTEASKQIQNYIATVSGSGTGVDKVKRIFLQSNPLLEAFGNAKTLRNNNSSRFGKYFELLFDSAGRPQGGQVTNYLLEKSRVVKPGKGERNFHIFYQLLAGLPESGRRKLLLSSCSDYQSLACSGCFDIDDINDAKEFQETMEAMTHVGIKKKQVELVLQLVAAVLHMGNVKFSPKQVGDAEGSSVKDRTPLKHFCDLAGLDLDKLEHALCYRLLQTMAPGGKVESYEVPQNPHQAAASRDSIAKDIYSRVFDFLVERVNSALDIEKKAEKTGEILNVDDMRKIGILDIYGFEIFDKNGFEQFCINYVNEKLQQIFIELTLKSEQEEYKREGIQWTPIPFFNNKIVCDLIEAKRPPGIFLILDDTIKTMHSRQGSSIDSTFLDKLSSLHQGHKHFSKRGKVFEIKHYAGDVQYSVDNFGDSNKDFLSKDIALLINSSSNKLMQHIFPETIDLNDRRMPKTAGLKIRTQCAALVEALMECTPNYVRCMKSNDLKKPNKIDDKRVIHQAQYLGLLENIKVRRAGYAYRGDYGRFVDRFRLLSKETYPEFRGSDKKGTKAILRAATKHLPQLEHEVQLGKTMLFIQTPELYFNLEKLRDRKIGSFASKIQRRWKKYSGRRHLLKLGNDMTQLYQANNKSRQRVSIYRPFDADYLLDVDVREGILEILSYYNDSNNFVFIDTIQKAIPDTGNGITLSDRIFLVTDEHFYLFEKRWWTPTPDPKHPFDPPLVYLRRRFDLDQLEEIGMTTYADPLMILRITPHVVLPQPDKSNWLDDKTATACMDTKKPFGLFNRRHHCRFTGKIYCKEVCQQTEVVPDRGYYSPVRVHDSVIGFVSTEIPEDQLLLVEKKTELSALLIDLIKRKTKKRIPIKFQDDQIQLRTALNNVALSRSPKIPIVVSESSSTENFTIESRPDSIQIYVSTGVPEQYVKQRRKREKERQKRMEKRRQEEADIRSQRKAKREQEREKERLERIAEKKARKQAEKEAKKQAAMGQTRKSSRENVRAFGESIAPKPSNVNNELAAILARRRGGE